MRTYLSIICLVIFSSRVLSQNVDIDSDLIRKLENFEIREISVRKAVIIDEYLSSIMEVAKDHDNKDEIYLDPIVIPNKAPINGFNKILIFGYITKYGIKDEGKVAGEVNSILKVVSQIASRENVKLISIRPTIKSVQGGNEYYAEKNILYYQLENNEWRIEE